RAVSCASVSLPHRPTSAPHSLSLHDALPICGALRFRLPRNETSAGQAASRRRRRLARVGVGVRARVRLARLRSHEQRASERGARSEEHTSELQSRENLVCRLLLEKKKKKIHP